MLAYRIARTGSFIVNSNNAGFVCRWALASKLQTTTGTTIIDASPQQQLIRYFETSSCGQGKEKQQKPGSLAFADCDSQAISDLFYHFVQIDGGIDSEQTATDHFCVCVVFENYSLVLVNVLMKLN